jgi:hypothetical protein
LRSRAIDYTSTRPSHVYSLSEDRGGGRCNYFVPFNGGRVQEPSTIFALRPLIDDPNSGEFERISNKYKAAVAKSKECVARVAEKALFECDCRLPQQQAGVLIFAATVQTAKHQKKIDDIGFSAGPAGLQCDVIDFEFAQLKLQFGQIRGLARQELCVGKTQQLFLFGMQSRSSSMRSTMEGSKRAIW